MKRFRTKITISNLCFAVGVCAVAIWLVKFKPDPNIYAVEFSDLMRESENYDGKIIQIKALYAYGYHAAFLTDSNDKYRIRPTCLLEEESCEKVFDSLLKSIEGREETIVIGRYRHLLKHERAERYIHTIEVMEVKPTDTLPIIK